MKVIVRGGMPGTVNVEVQSDDGTAVGRVVEISNALTAYQALHELQPFLQELVDRIPDAPPAGAAVERRPSKAPKADA